jgi:hypothetical protein
MPEENKRVLADFNLLPSEGNWAYLDTNKYKQGGEFSFRVHFNLVVGTRDLCISAISCEYYAPDGCQCLNLNPKLKIAGKEVQLGGDNSSLEQPIKLAADSAIRISYWRRLRPPFSRQEPADCDNGDLHVKVRYLSEMTEQVAEFFFRLVGNGTLVRIESIREPPILSDTIVDRLRTNGLVTEEEYTRMKRIKAVDRYHAVRFPNSFNRIGITAEDEVFLREVHARQLP